MNLNNIVRFFKQDKLSDWLQYEVYDEERSLYLNADDTLGFMLEIPPIMFAGENLIQGYTSFLEQEWPEDSLVQVLLYADPNMLGTIKNYEQRRLNTLDPAKKTDQFLLSWTKWQANYLHEHHKGGVSEKNPVPFRNFRCFITAKIPFTKRDLRTQIKFDKIAALRDSIQGMLRTNNISAVNVHPAELIKCMWQILNPGHPFLEKNFYDKRRPIRKQVVAPDTECKVSSRRKFRLDGYNIAIRIPQVYPGTTTCFNTNTLCGDLMGSNMEQICCPFLLTLNIDTNPIGNEMNMKAEVTAAQSAAMKQMAPKLHRKNEEYAWAASEQESGKKFIKSYLTLVLFEKNTKKMSRCVSMATGVWGNNGYRLQEELFASPAYFLAALPFGCLRSGAKEMDRWLSAPAETHAVLAPIQADWRGTPTEGMLFLTRRGQICSLDFFDSDTNYNFAVAAPSGSGKSFFVNKVLMENASRGGINFVIDVGKSYKKQCGLLNGQYLEFEEGRNISLNVFSELTSEIFTQDRKELDKEGKENLTKRASLLALYTQLLAVMANPKDKIDQDDYSSLETVVIKAYSNLKQGEYVTIDDFIRLLRDEQEENDRQNKQEHKRGLLADRLAKYGKNGQYGHWFQGKINVEFTNPFVVLELEQLNAQPALREVILLLLISIIEQSFFFGDRSVPKVVLFDEAWDLFKNPNTAAFIETAYRRARKYGSSIGTIVQSFLDFNLKGNASVGQAIMSNSEWKIALKPNVAELQKAQKENILSLSASELRIAETVRTIRGLFSELLLVSSGQSAVFRYIPTPQEKVAFTTDPNEVQMYETLYDMITPNMLQGNTYEMVAMCLAYNAYELHKQGASIREAINLTIENYDDAIKDSLKVFQAI